MCATNLEGNANVAALDLAEMIQARISEIIKLLVMTGGTKKWTTEQNLAELVGEEKAKGYLQPSNEETQLFEITAEQ